MKLYTKNNKEIKKICHDLEILNRREYIHQFCTKISSNLGEYEYCTLQLYGCGCNKHDITK